MPNWRVSLYDIDGPLLVLPLATGVTYFNQVGGEVCYQAEAEGALLPLDLNDVALESLDSIEFASSADGLSEADADALQELLDADPVGRALTINRGRLAESWEAWVHVLVDSKAANTAFLVETDAPDFEAVLTWMNSA